MTPKCAQCAGQQRWVAQNGVWYCDRCQLWMQHSQPPTQEPTLRPTMGEPNTSHANARKKWANLVSIVVVVAVMAIVLSLSLGRDDPPVPTSPTELGDAAVTAAVDGDVDRLVALSGGTSLHSSLQDCWEDFDLQIMRLSLKRKTRRAKGLRHNPVTGVEKKDDRKQYKKGERVGNCENKRDFLTQGFEIVDRHGDAIADMIALQVGERWYLMDIWDLSERELTDKEREEELKDEREIRKRTEALEAARKKLTRNEE